MRRLTKAIALEILKENRKYRYLSQDLDGSIYMFPTKPTLYEERGEWCNDEDNGIEYNDENFIYNKKIQPVYSPPVDTEDISITYTDIAGNETVFTEKRIGGETIAYLNIVLKDHKAEIKRVSGLLTRHKKYNDKYFNPKNK